MSHLLAAETTIGNFVGIGPLGTNAIQSASNAALNLDLILSNVIGLLTVLAGIWFFYQIIIAALAWISAGGDKQNLQTAQKRMTNAVIGLFIVVAAYAIVGVIGRFVGLNILEPWADILLLHP